MLNFIFWLLTFLGIIALLAFAWRSAMRRRGFRLIGMLEQEGVIRHAVDVPVRVGESPEGVSLRPGWLARRGTLVLTRKRLAGFAHRARFVLVRGGGARADAVRAEGEWLLVWPEARRARKPGSRVVFRYAVEDPQGWAREATRVLRGR